MGPPKNAYHLYNFGKEEKCVSVKYKQARLAFDRIKKEKETVSMEGSHTRSNTDLGLKSKHLKKKKECDDILVLKVTKYTSDDDLVFIKAKFLELLQAFRSSILHDPVSPLQLFNFINEDTEYKVRYGDVKKCYNYAVKHKWFKPMKRMKKVNKKKKKKVVRVMMNQKKALNLF